MFFRQVFDPELAQYAYMIGCQRTGEALVIDPDQTSLVAMTDSDLDELRAVGLAEKDILDMTQIVAYFNFVNRMALGLGVAFTADELSGYKDD